jgi:hypothetical protein
LRRILTIRPSRKAIDGREKDHLMRPYLIFNFQN